VRGRLTALLTALILAAAFLAACERIDRNMWDNPAYKPQEEPVRLPPKDSVPTKGKEHVPPMREAATLANPVKPAEGVLLKGKELYGIFCVPCHGATGAGDGPVGKKYVPTPAALHPGSPAGKLSDGELFAVISNGSGGMPAFRSDLAPAERWHVVTFLRTLK
jgi:mono/diheme cytochrome c family protein